MFLLQASFLLGVNEGNSVGNEFNLTFDVFSSFFIVHLLGKVRYRLVWCLSTSADIVLRHSWNAESRALEGVAGAWRQNERRRGHGGVDLAGPENYEFVFKLLC